MWGWLHKTGRQLLMAISPYALSCGGRRELGSTGPAYILVECSGYELAQHPTHDAGTALLTRMWHGVEQFYGSFWLRTELADMAAASLYSRQPLNGNLSGY